MNLRKACYFHAGEIKNETFKYLSIYIYGSVIYIAKMSEVFAERQGDFHTCQNLGEKKKSMFQIDIFRE